MKNVSQREIDAAMLEDEQIKYDTDKEYKNSDDFNAEYDYEQYQKQMKAEEKRLKEAEENNGFHFFWNDILEDKDEE